MTVDLEECTSKYLRTCLEEALGLKLTDLRSFVDNEMINILRQMDAATPILDFLYLGRDRVYILERWLFSTILYFCHTSVCMF